MRTDELRTSSGSVALRRSVLFRVELHRPTCATTLMVSTLNQYAASESATHSTSPWRHVPARQAQTKDDLDAEAVRAHLHVENDHDMQLCRARLLRGDRSNRWTALLIIPSELAGEVAPSSGVFFGFLIWESRSSSTTRIPAPRKFATRTAATSSPRTHHAAPP